MGDYAAAAAAAAPSTAKTSVWWDVDKCAVLRGCCHPHLIAYNIIAALAGAGCVGPVSIAAYGDATRVHPTVLAALSATGICLNHVPAGSKDTSEKRMLVDMLFWAFDNPPPGNYLLISGDPDLSDLLHRLRMKRYDILLVRPPNVSSQALAAAAKKVWLWESLTAGEGLLPGPQPAISVLGCKLDGKACFEYGKGDANGKAGNQNMVKPLQKYVKKTYSSPTPAIDQDRVAQAAGVSESSIGSTSSELDHSCVTSLSSSSSESPEGAKVDATVPLENATSAKSSSHKPLLTECLRRNATLGKAGNQNRVKPLQKYVKKTNSSSTPAINQDRVAQADRVSESSTGSTSSELEHSCVTSLSSSSSESSEGAKVDATVPLENATSAKSSSHKPVLTRCLRRNATLGKAGNQNRVKPLQKYVKKTNNSSTPAINQDRVAQAPRVSENSIGSTSNEVEHSCVTSLSSSSSESSEGAKLDATVPLENATSAKSSSHKPVCLIRNATLDFGASNGHYNQMTQHLRCFEAQNKLHSEFTICGNKGKAVNQHGVLPFQKYVKKTTVTPSSANKQVGSTGVSDRHKGSNTIEQDRASVVLSPTSKSLEGSKADSSVLLETPTLPHTSAQQHDSLDQLASAHLHQLRAPHESILGKKPSTSVRHASRNGTHDFDVTTIHYHPACQQLQSFKAQNKLHSYSSMGHNSGKLGSENKFNQHKASVERINISLAWASNEIDPTNKFLDYSKGSTLSHQSMSASSSSKPLESAKVNQSSLLSAHKPVMIDHLHQDGAASVFGNEASTSFQHTDKIGTSEPVMIDNLHQDGAASVFGNEASTSFQQTVKIGASVFDGSSGLYHPTYQQAESFPPPEYNSGTNPHMVHCHSHSKNSHSSSSASPSVAHSGVVRLFVFLLHCLCCGSFIVSDET